MSHDQQDRGGHGESDQEQPSRSGGGQPGRLRDRLARPVSVAVLVVSGVVGGGVAVALASQHSPAPASQRAAAVVSGDATGSTVAAPTTTGTTTTTPSVPSGFADSLVTLYTQQYNTITTLDSSSSALSGEQIPNPSDFQQEVNSLTPKELAQLYEATLKTGAGWGEAETKSATLAQDAKSYANAAERAAASRSARSVARPRSAGRLSRGATRAKGTRATLGFSGSLDGGRTSAVRSADDTAAGSFPPPEPTGSFPNPPSAFQPTQTPGTATLMSCSSGAPGGPSEAPGEAGIFAAQIVLDVASMVSSDISATVDVLGESLPNPVKYVAAAIQEAAQITVDTLTYVQTIAADCASSNESTEVSNIDNTTLQLYALESGYIEPTLDNVENSVNTIHQQVHVVQETLDEQLTLDIQQALSNPAGDPINIDYMLPASAGGNLDSTPIGVREVVSNALAAAQSAGVAVNAMAGRYLRAANAALAAGQYRTAWTNYREAYQELGSG